ncbi:MAG: Hsp33 family molecular chaperone HslO [Clostridia bacterium]|nr:Hsp33 family molecular chaperone HslO [Clostridia bacterium]
MSNKLYKTLIYDMQVSLSVLDTTKLVNDAIKIHKLDDTSAKLLGGLLTACAYMAGCLKSEKGAVSITVKSGDGSATASVSGDINGHIRGYIDGAEYGLKGGVMTVIKEDGFYRPFVGTSELKCNDVAENLMQYYHASEQIPTAVAIGVKVENGICTTAGGVIMQLLPGTTDYNMDKAEEAMQNFVNVADVLEKYGADGIMEKYFGEETDDKGIYLSFPEYKCNCSRKKIEGVIMPLGKSDLMKIIKEDGKVSVHCHYCNTDYDFTAKDIEELFSANG